VIAVRAFLRRLAAMGDWTYFLLSRGLLLSLACAGCALLVRAVTGAFDAHTYFLWQYARSLAQAPAGILLLAVLGSAIVEDALDKE